MRTDAQIANEAIRRVTQGDRGRGVTAATLPSASLGGGDLPRLAPATMTPRERQKWADGHIGSLLDKPGYTYADTRLIAAVVRATVEALRDRLMQEPERVPVVDGPLHTCQTCGEAWYVYDRNTQWIRDNIEFGEGENAGLIHCPCCPKDGDK